MNLKQNCVFVFKNTKTNKETGIVGTSEEHATSKLLDFGTTIGEERNKSDYIIIDKWDCKSGDKGIFVDDDENLYLKEEDGSFSLFFKNSDKLSYKKHEDGSITIYG